MAKVGVKHIVAALLNENESGNTYSDGFVVAKAIKVSTSIEVHDDFLYADDYKAESDTSFKNGTVSYDIDHLTDETRVKVLGHSYGDTVDTDIGTKEVISKDTDEQPYVGTGFYGAIKRNSITRYQAVWINKVKFKEPEDSAETKGENISFQTTTIEGIIEKSPYDKNYRIKADFSTEAKAQAWLDAKAGITQKASGAKSSVVSGEYTKAQNVTLSTTEVGGKIYYTTDGTIPSETNGTLYTTAIACDKASNQCIKAIVVKENKASSDILELYIKVS